METIIKRTLQLLLDAYGADYDVVMVSEKSGHYTANVETQDPSRLIGRSGTILNALQTLLKNILWNQTGEKIFVSIDIDGYRAAQNEKLFDRVGKVIARMKEQNLSEMKLDPMKPYTRRLVHLWIVETYPELTSDSQGEGMARAIRVFYK